MALKKLLGMIAAVIGVIAAVELGIAVYFYRRTMMTEPSKWQEQSGISTCHLFRREKKQC